MKVLKPLSDILRAGRILDNTNAVLLGMILGRNVGIKTSERHPSRRIYFR